MSQDARLPGIRAFQRPQPRMRHVPSPWSPSQPDRLIETPGHFSDDTGFFHDGSAANMARLQLGEGRALLRTTAFDGDYLSLAVALPHVMGSTLGRAHDLRISLTLQNQPPVASPAEGFLRVNVDDSGALWQQSVALPIIFDAQRIPLGPGSGLPDPVPGATRKVWVDIVFTGCADSAVTVENVVLTRDPMPVV